MSQAEKQQYVLRLFFLNKFKLKELYELYSLKFPQYGNLWRNLVKTKNGQLKAIADFIAKLGGREFCRLNDYSGQIIGYIGEFLDDQLKKVKSQRQLPKEALGITLSLEQSMLEKKSSEIIYPLNSRLELILNKIKWEADRQQIILTKAFEKASRV